MTRPCWALENFFAAVADHTKVVILHGEGEHFCAGLDLSELREADLAEGMAHSRLWHRAFEHIEFGRVPVVAVLHGAVVGGGLELAAACHIRIAERSAYYALPEGSRGIFVGGGGSVRLPRLLGTSCVIDMMLTGRTYDADDPAVRTFSQYVVEAGTGLAKAIELAERIAGNAADDEFRRDACAAAQCRSRSRDRPPDGIAHVGDRPGRSRGEAAPARFPGKARSQDDP